MIEEEEELDDIDLVVEVVIEEEVRVIREVVDIKAEIEIETEIVEKVKIDIIKTRERKRKCKYQ